VPIKALAALRRRLAALPGRHPQRETLLSLAAELYGAQSRDTVSVAARRAAHRDAIPLAVAPRVSCRRQRSSAGARSSPP
jgi:hypothetical protein